MEDKKLWKKNKDEDEIRKMLEEEAEGDIEEIRNGDGVLLCFKVIKDKSVDLIVPSDIEVTEKDRSIILTPKEK